MASTNAALRAAGYTTAPSSSYGCKLILRDGRPVGHHDAITAWDLPGVREAGVAIDDGQQHDVHVRDRDADFDRLLGRPAPLPADAFARRRDLLGAHAG